MLFEHVLRDPVLIVLFAASLVSWGIILDCLLVLRGTIRGDRAFLSGDSVAASALAAIHSQVWRHAAGSRDHLLVVIDTSIALQRQRLERMLPVLGAIGSTAPYVGLLGTVIGIIQAFQAIQAQNNMSPSIVAGGIATALIATAAGLAVAIPAVVAHHLISAAIKRRASFWEAVASEWLPEHSEKEVVDGAFPHS
jgi:biopolymer transport protein TolQ